MSTFSLALFFDASYVASMKYKTHNPYPHQIEAANRAYDKGRFAFLFEVGAGKTFATILTLRKHYSYNKKLLRTLVISPQVTLYNWKEEFKINSFVEENKVNILLGNGAKRIKHLEKMVQDDGIIILNYECLLNEKIFDLLSEWKPSIIVADEMHLIKNPKSKRAKKVVDLADDVRNRNGHVYGLTGTAILNSIEDVYMQWRYLDGGDLFGKNFFVFRSKYLEDKNSGWSSRPGYFPDYQPRTEMYGELQERIYSIAMRVTKKDVLKDLPPLIKTKRYVEMSKEQARLYKEMKDDFIAFIKDKTAEGMTKASVANLAITKALRLCQITSGFLVDEQGKVHEIEDTPKIKATEDLLVELVPDNKVIIWCCFIHNYKMLGKLCDKLKLKHVFITGEMDAKEKSEAIQAFQTDDTVRVCIANRRAGGIGINLTAASYSLIFSRNFSLGEELQSEARNYRPGSEVHSAITKIDILAKGTIDEFTLKALDNKQNISDIIIDNMGEI